MLIFFCRFCCSGQVLQFHRSSRGPLVVWCLACFETNPQENPRTRWAPSPVINGITPITGIVNGQPTEFITLSIAGRCPSCRKTLARTFSCLDFPKPPKFPLHSFIKFLHCQLSAFVAANGWCSRHVRVAP